jgi:hypothetical protein
MKGFSMYRRNAAQTPRPGFIRSTVDSVAAAVAKMMTATIEALYEQAWRENRQRDRFETHARRHTTYHARGLNGDRAVERRRRQIAASQITKSNGLTI